MQLDTYVYIVRFVYILCEILSYSILIRIVVSWFSGGSMGRGSNVFMQFVYDVSEPVLIVARRFPHRYKMMDFSPIIALLAIDFFRYYFVYLMSFLGF